MNILVKKATIVSSLFLKYQFDQTDIDVKNSISTDSDAPIHDDLRNAFRSLIPHFAFICEEITDEELVAEAIRIPESYLEDQDNAASDVFFKYRVYDFALKGKGDAEKLTISGSKRLNSGKTISFSTPEMHLDDIDYKFSSDLKEVIELLRSEVLAYMQGKQAPKVQTEMFGDETEEEHQDAAFN